MITRAEIAAEEAALGPDAIASWLTLFRSYSAYSAETYPNIVTRLEEAVDLPAKQLNAALKKIEAIGAGTVKIQGGRNALDFDQERDRRALIEYGLAVLYEMDTSNTDIPPSFIVV